VQHLVSSSNVQHDYPADPSCCHQQLGTVLGHASLQPSSVSHKLAPHMALLCCVVASSSPCWSGRQQHCSSHHPLLMRAVPPPPCPQVLSWLCSVAALCDTQPGTADQLDGLWLADVLSFLYLTRSAYSPGEWARLVPALATVASAGLAGFDAGQAAWDEDVLQQLEGLAAVSGLSLVPGRQRGGQEADGGYTVDELVALAQGFARLEYSPGPEWLAAHEGALVAAGVRGLQQAGLVAPLAEAYEVLGHRVTSVALRAAVASQ
jgi:hypothetical protein